MINADGIKAAHDIIDGIGQEGHAVIVLGLDKDSKGNFVAVGSTYDMIYLKEYLTVYVHKKMNEVTRISEQETAP